MFEESEYYFSTDGSVQGPYPLNELVKLINFDTLVYREGIDWTIASDLVELKMYFNESNSKKTNSSEKTKTKKIVTKKLPSNAKSHIKEVSELTENQKPFSKKSNISLSELLLKLEAADNKKDNNYDLDERRARIIMQHPIPLEGEDILEFLSYSFPILENGIDDYYVNEETKAWKTKIGQVILKMKLAQGNGIDKNVVAEFDKKFNSLLEKEKEKEKENYITAENKNWWIYFTFLLLSTYLVFAFIASWFGAEYWPFN